MKNKILVYICSFFVSLLILVFSSNILFNSSSNSSLSIFKNKIFAKNSNYIDIKISAVGDIIVHDDQLKSQYIPQSKSYDFTEYFSHVSDYLSNSDYSIANLEGTLGGEKRKFSGYPSFNTPDEILDALKYSGFDMVTAANNHILDKGTSGLKRTVDIAKEKGLDIVGIKSDSDDVSYIVKDIKGIKIGFANYVFETPYKNGSKTLNSTPIPDESLVLMDSFNPNRIEDTLYVMSKRVEDLKKAGAEFIIFSLHWGDEYINYPNNYQKKLAKGLSDIGVDVILGSNPHNIQPMEFISSEVTGKETFVIYSMGNFISNQRYETLKKPSTEDGIIVNLNITKNLKTKDIQLKKVDYIPTWVNRTKKTNGTFNYSIIPLNENIIKNNNFNLSEDALERAKNSNENTKNLIESYSSKFTIAQIN